MLRIMLLTLTFLYAAACYGTMPAQCFTARHAIECQRVQISAIAEWRSLNWGTVYSVNELR